MDPDLVIFVGQQAMKVMVLLTAPLLLTALAVGLLIGMLQAATQINEMTLSFIPKLMVVAAVLAIAGPWMLQLLVDYTRELIESLPHLVG
ncbi:MAG: flagellar biosynthesis protein FliQ [Gammaproteobacteria bacterium]